VTKQRPGDKPQWTPWHPELGHKKALALLALYGLVFLLGLLCLAGVHDHIRTVHYQQPAQILVS